MYILAKRAQGSNNMPEFGKPVIHTKMFQAEAEAARLAGLHLGYEFLIYAPVKKASAELPRVQWEDMS